MIPVKLELTNFLSYRQPVVLDFAGIHTACIAGPNGAGKSSLLDGLTWALFAQSRNKSDDDVINRLAVARGEAAEVRFTFSLENNIYRVIRRKQAGKTARLDLQMHAGNQGSGSSWKSLTEGRLRDTQEAIQSLLKMNFDTFTNASFFLQGKADSFTTRTPGKRKEVLAALIGISQWEEYRERASNQRRQSEGEMQLLDGRLADIAVELGKKEAREAALEMAIAEQARIREKLDDKEKLLEQMRRQAEAVKRQKETVRQFDSALASEEQALADSRQRAKERREKLAGYRQILDQAEEINRQYDRWREVDQAWKDWQERERAFQQLRQAQHPHELAIAQAESRLKQKLAQLTAESQEVARRTVDAERLRADILQSRSTIAGLEETVASLAGQEAAYHAERAALQELEAARRLLEQELAQWQRQALSVDKARRKRQEVAENLTQAEAALERLEQQVGELATQRAELAQAQGERDALLAEQPALRQAMDELKERIDRLQPETKGVCPLCGQPLSREHRQKVLQDLQQEGEQRGARFRRNRERAAELEQLITSRKAAVKQGDRLERELQSQRLRQGTAAGTLQELDRQIEAWEEEGGATRLLAIQAELDNDTALPAQRAKVAALAQAAAQKEEEERLLRLKQQEVAKWEAEVAQIDLAKQRWQEEGAPQLAEVTRQLDGQEFALEARRKVAQLQAQAEAVGFDAAASAAVAAQREALAQVPPLHDELRQAQAAVKPLETNLADLEDQIARHESRVAELQEQLANARAQLEEMAAGEEELPALEQVVAGLREEVVRANQQVGAARQKLEVLDALRAQQKEHQASRSELSRRIQRLRLLEQACSRNGVQALLIDHALPEIEDHANELLDRLTEGAMHVKFETQRQSKTRDELLETLDIRISDASGERPYESFSGGEQFRVNFAIRLALSRLLAQRAGARLQTLVIDEGFGSQDPLGRQRLVEAIHAIQDDYACVLVITHVEELRDAFPTRIDVEKGRAGSTISVG